MSNVKSLQIPVSVTKKKKKKKWLPYMYDPKITWNYVQIPPDLIDRYLGKILYLWEHILDIQR